MLKKTNKEETSIKKITKKASTKKNSAAKAAKKLAKSIVFKIYAPEARNIFLAADFNNWDISSLPMQRRNDGVWEVTIELAKGAYHYKYFVDGRWENDIQEEMQPNSFGSMNNIIRIE